MFVDTATLYPVSPADLVLRLAELGLFELLWSDHLLAEVERVLVECKGLAGDPSRDDTQSARRYQAAAASQRRDQDLLSALGGTRTPNLLIRRRGHRVCVVLSNPVVPGHGRCGIRQVSPNPPP